MIKYEDFELHNIATNHKACIAADSVYKFNVDDKISPNYNESAGYGKFDPLLVYKNTTRTVQVQISLKGAIDYSYLIKDFALITIPKYDDGYMGGSTVGSVYTSTIKSAPLYKLKLFGYFEEFGVIKDLQVKPSFEAKDIAFVQDGFLVSGESATNKKYGFTKLDISFGFTVLHRETPNTDRWESVSNWPFSS
ncbi:MAG: hypothetical protein RIR47_1016 [Bacteroidota bacterium]|jgi:hypothetical protein